MERQGPDAYGHAARALHTALPRHIWAAPRMQEDDNLGFVTTEYCGMISSPDMPVDENDVVVAVSNPNGDLPFGSALRLEVEAAVTRGPVFRSILKKVE